MRSGHSRTVYRTLIAIALLTMQGCRGQEAGRPAPGPPWSVAVVPFTNQSGSETLDPLAVTDEFYTELQLAGDGVSVLPVNRVLAAMNSLSLKKIATPSDVELLADALQVDAVIVGAVTLYDPYPPPRVGLIVQLYDRKKWASHDPVKHVDPGQLARSGSGFDLNPPEQMQPIAQVIRVVDAGTRDVIERLKIYANRHMKDEVSSWREPWQRYTTSRNYLRFVSHEVIGELFDRRRSYLAGRPLDPKN